MENYYCSEWRKSGFICEEQCQKCAKLDTPMRERNGERLYKKIFFQTKECVRPNIHNSPVTLLPDEQETHQRFMVMYVDEMIELLTYDLGHDSTAKMILEEYEYVKSKLKTI